MRHRAASGWKRDSTGGKSTRMQTCSDMLKKGTTTSQNLVLGAEQVTRDRSRSRAAACHLDGVIAGASIESTIEVHHYTPDGCLGSSAGNKLTTMALVKQITEPLLARESHHPKLVGLLKNYGAMKPRRSHNI